METFTLDPEVLAFSRQAVEGMLTDTCYIHRRFIAPNTGPEEPPAPGLSDGRGGTTGGAGVPGVDSDGFIRDSSATACRLQYVLPKRGHGEEPAIAGVEERTITNFAIANSAELNERDRVEVHERATGDVTMWEVTYAAPHTDSYTRQFALLRIGVGTILE